jgi:multidrug transporter EmrE-like cation transporter
MQNTLLPLLVTVALTVLSVFADYLLKRASASLRPFSRWEFAAAVFIYAASCFAWIYVLRQLKLATIGAIYSVLVVGLLALIGITVFRESLSIFEWVGLAAAAAALVLLGRFAYL